MVVYGAVGVSARLHGRLVPESGKASASTGSNGFVGCLVGNPARSMQMLRSVSCPVGVRRRAFGGLWCCRCFGETAWSVGAGDRAETSIDRFQSVRGLLGGESRGCDRGLRVSVGYLLTPAITIPPTPHPSVSGICSRIRHRALRGLSSGLATNRFWSPLPVSRFPFPSPLRSLVSKIHTHYPTLIPFNPIHSI